MERRTKADRQSTQIPLFRLGMILLSVLLMMGNLSCYKDKDVITTVEKPLPPQVIVDAEVALQVTDEEGNVLSGAMVRFDGQEQSLDQEPYIHLNGTAVNKRHELLEVSHPDLGITSFHLALQENDITYRYLSIETDRSSNSFHSSSGQDIVDNGTHFMTEPNTAIVIGSPYQGQIESVSYSRKIESREDLLQVPGGQIGLDRDENPGFLEFKSLILYRAVSETGDPVTYDPDDFRISAGSLCGDCAVFQLDTDGTWEEVEDWTKNGNEYRFYAEAGGYFCVATFSSFILLKGELVADDLPMAHARVTAVRNGEPLNLTYTSNKGSYEMYLPANQDISLDFRSPCGLSRNLSIQTEFSDMEFLTEMTNETELYRVEGVVRDCDDSPLESHFIEVRSGDNSTIYLLNQSNFSLPVEACNGEIAFQSTTTDWEQSGPLVTWPVEPEINIRTSYACEAARQEYFTIRINNDHKIYWNTSSTTAQGSRTQLVGDDPSIDGDQLTLWISGMSAGNFEDTQLNILLFDIGAGLSNGGYSLYCPTSSQGCGFEQFVITHFGSTGEWIRGYFEGTFWVKTFQPPTAGNRQITGEFQVFRDF